MATHRRPGAAALRAGGTGEHRQPAGGHPPRRNGCGHRLHHRLTGTAGEQPFLPAVPGDWTGGDDPAHPAGSGGIAAAVAAGPRPDSPAAGLCGPDRPAERGGMAGGALRQQTGSLGSGSSPWLCPDLSGAGNRARHQHGGGDSPGSLPGFSGLPGADRQRVPAGELRDNQRGAWQSGPGQPLGAQPQRSGGPTGGRASRQCQRRTAARPQRQRPAAADPVTQADAGTGCRFPAGSWRSGCGDGR